MGSGEAFVDIHTGNSISGIASVAIAQERSRGIDAGRGGTAIVLPRRAEINRGTRQTVSGVTRETLAGEGALCVEATGAGRRAVVQPGTAFVDLEAGLAIAGISTIASAGERPDGVGASSPGIAIRQGLLPALVDIKACPDGANSGEPSIALANERADIVDAS